MNDTPTANAASVDKSPLPRSPELMSADDTALLIVDVQGKLLTLVPNYRRIVWNIRRLLDGAETLGVVRGATEQYPKGLGPTVPELATKFASIPSKMAFSCAECGELFRGWHDRGIRKILVTGIEAHVCVQQTVFDLMTHGFHVYLAVDAVGSRSDLDRDVALRRMESAGVTLTTTESALFEWCVRAGTPEFKTISNLVKESSPE